MARSPLLAVLSCSLLACTGMIDGPGNVPVEPPDVPHEPAACGADTVELYASDLRRLSKRELSHSLADLLGPAVLAAVAPRLAAIPAEATDVAFDTQDNTVEFIHVDSLFTLAEAIAEELVERQPAFHGLSACFTGPTAAQRTCFAKFLGDFGAQVMRRPLDAETEARYLAAYDALAGQPRKLVAKVLIAALFQSPRYVYVLELDGAARDASERVLELTPYERAARLALDYAGTTPDAELLRAAAAGELSAPEQLEAQARRLLESAKGRAHVADYVSQYLHLDALPEPSYSPGFLAGLGTATLRAQLRDEALAYFEHHTFSTRGTFGDLMTSRVAFPAKAELARLYGVPAAAGPTELTDLRRKGLLTRAALLASGQDEVNPFHRGKVVLEDFLCSPIGRPDPDALPDAFSVTPDEGTTSTRLRLEQLTKSNVCQGCHQKLNPIGFAFEEFDGLGRHRTTETLQNAQTKLPATYPIDARTTLPLDGQSHTLDGVADLSELLGKHPGAAKCFATKWYGFARGKREHHVQERCSVEQLAAAATDPARGVRGMYEALARLPQYGLRVKPAN